MRLTIVGDLRAYKNAEWAAEFISNTNQGLSLDQFIELRIAGKSISKGQSDYLLRLASLHDFISLDLQRLSDDQLLHEFCEADFIFAPYSDLLTSGICINSISHGTPFIAPSFPYLIELHRENRSFIYETLEELAVTLLRFNDYFHGGLLPCLFDRKKIIADSSDLEWPNIFASLHRDPFALN